MDPYTWKSYITAKMNIFNESWDDVVSCTLTEEELREQFNSELYGVTEGRPFTLWTKTRVYFPVQYDGMEWVESVSRHPDGKPTRHFGGQCP